jgi:hypothetical protein
MPGERANAAYACTPWNCIGDLTAVFDYAKSLASDMLRLFEQITDLVANTCGCDCFDIAGKTFA